jgi:hypothetical protein
MVAQEAVQSNGERQQAEDMQRVDEREQSALANEFGETYRRKRNTAMHPGHGASP